MSESALVVRVPAAEPCVAALRELHDPVARRGMPAHITLLYPFVAPNEITPAVLARVQRVAAEFPSHPPYGGRPPTIVPHLTVGHTPGDGAAIERELRANLARLGTIEATCDAVDLMDDAAGTWQLRHRFGLQP